MARYSGVVTPAKAEVGITTEEDIKCRSARRSSPRVYGDGTNISGLVSVIVDKPLTDWGF
ncbi:hypothetical protein ACM41_13885 [Bradyrhizobium sp. CCBAU 21362]|nr:hypothetical protein [Bradyrhizobium sp. CCBAU 21362]